MDRLTYTHASNVGNGRDSHRWIALKGSQRWGLVLENFWNALKRITTVVALSLLPTRVIADPIYSNSVSKPGFADSKTGGSSPNFL